MKIKNVRLDKNIVPVSYDIEIKPDLDNFTFEGVETITMSLLKTTKSITVHSKEIEIETVSLKIGKEKIFANKISYNEKSETVTFNFKQNIKIGKNKLVIVFKGILNDKMRGFYRSTYNIKDKTHNMATTQFEATDARRAFPCFDEPAQKAIFNVSLIIPKGRTAISNTLPVSVKEHEGGYQIVKFSPTPKMSTYLLAFIVGDFEYVESKTNNGVQVRVFTTPGKRHQAGFALDCAVKTLEFYEKYFDISYPLPILDMIAIPDFASGAMENWGAITYRESALLVDEEQSSISNKQWVALVVAHEIAHQWFGNLVTMEWWTHLWLNEGFASYIEYLAIDKLFPKWDMWTQFTTRDLGIALRLDGLLKTHPIEIPVHHPDEISEIFDAVSYSKGASVIRMLAGYLGEKDFRDGLRYYLKKHSYKNTETIHLWQAFEKISKKPVSKMMHNWTSKAGYPVVKVNTKNSKLQITQERFFSSPISKIKAKDKTVWQIPVSMKRKTGEIRSFLDTSKKFISDKNLNEWLKINTDETGFFRTAYSKEMLEKLKEPVFRKILPPRDRLGIIRDLFALSEAGVIPTTDALSFLSAYKDENDYTVWSEISAGLSRLDQLLAKNKSTVENLNKLIISIFTPSMKRLGWNPRDKESHTDTLLRSLVISRLGRSREKSVVIKAKNLFKATLKGKKINPDIRGAVYGIVATNGGIKEYNAFIKKYKSESMHEERNRIGYTLGDFPNTKILKLACEFAISKNVRIQDSTSILSFVGANQAGRDIWLSFIKKNWKTFLTRYGDGGHELSYLVKAISGSAEKKHLSGFKKFFITHNAPGAKRAVEQTLERLNSNVVWLARDEKAIEKFLNK